jgi:hypothetical protein
MVRLRKGVLLGCTKEFSDAVLRHPWGGRSGRARAGCVNARVHTGLRRLFDHRFVRLVAFGGRFHHSRIGSLDWWDGDAVGPLCTFKGSANALCVRHALPHRHCSQRWRGRLDFAELRGAFHLATEAIRDTTKEGCLLIGRDRKCFPDSPFDAPRIALLQSDLRPPPWRWRRGQGRARFGALLLRIGEWIWHPPETPGRAASEKRASPRPVYVYC